jgi:hypothetical protein
MMSGRNQDNLTGCFHMGTTLTDNLLLIETELADTRNASLMMNTRVGQKYENIETT